MNQLETLSIQYDPIEDRLRLIGNGNQQGKRMDFWITRKMVTALILLCQIIQYRPLDQQPSV